MIHPPSYEESRCGCASRNESQLDASCSIPQPAPMADLSVHSISIDEVLQFVRQREWQVPQFQRDFVWSIANVIDLIHSILAARPIGMVTLWEQVADFELELEPISLTDRTGYPPVSTTVSISSTQNQPRKVYAILDGLQRCTSIGMAFGGLSTAHPTFRTSGRFFLHVVNPDPLEQVVFLRACHALWGGEKSVHSKHRAAIRLGWRRKLSRPEEPKPVIPAM